MKKTAIAVFAFAIALAAQAKVLKLDVPPVQIQGTPVPIKIENLDPKRGENPSIEVPDGVTNVAKGKAVTSSDDFPLIGELTCITDGDKAAAEGCYVELMGGIQWVQIDLGKSYDIHAIAMWHYHLQERAYRDVIVQVSDDKDFLKGVTTVYNNDHDNSSKKGKGDKKAYVETNFGKLIEVKPAVKGRYVRLYSNGNSTSDSNHYIEVEVFGK